MLLSSKCKQGNREFVNEIGMISALPHANLVKLYGCCVEGNQLMLGYEYMQNNCLSRALFVVIWLLSMQCVATKLTKKMFVALELLLWKLLVAYVLQERGSLSELVDPELGSEYSSEEAMVMLNVALSCKFL
ncbi:hypothetical protein POPTR_018G135901v4 [Populus trichocarpa]|uniref:Serine-threonine/tyrosine-protein kinase catalytic domain-containing protein n=1 Tax=Populus trichocarpa TaxID=3694 RepID=A0A3N7HAS4_POPTR|nr:hypothetical protein BDE02_18G125200 [Populus trichocarpa]RQP03112.1 hypothetical protein POPTR_018G135901v4 [Populus trichocarpa]